VNGRREISLTWQEMDGPEITPPKRRGFGTRLLEDVVAHELKGKSELLYDPRGLQYRLDFPVDE
jgi:two-component sensor histidine kinase